jgi:exodeoxyribonuclease-5
VTLPPPSPAASDDQLEVLRAFDAFLASRDERVFVLSGAAGTGKTTLLDKMMGRVQELHRRARLTALTGRAASVARLRAGREASTLHSFLYRFDPRSSKVIDGV